MKKGFIILIIFTFVSCATSTKINSNPKPLYEVLLQQNYGGATIRFFEILSEPKEIMMLQKDPKLKNRINPTDIETCNFVVMNMGEKPTAGYRIEIQSVIETDKNIIITTKEIAPFPGSISIQQISTPYYIVKINSKKEILFK
jgi:hypothetical protein